MKERYRMLFIMTGAQMCASVVQQGFGALAPFIVDAFHLSKTQLGASFTAVMIGGAFAGAVSGYAVDRFGERGITSLCGIAIFFALCLAAAVPSYTALVFSLFILGLVYAAISPAGGRAILGWFDRDRGFAMGIRQTGIPLGAVLGGLLLPFLAVHFGYRVALLSGAVLALVGTGGLPLFYKELSSDEAPVRRISTYFGGLRAIVADPRTIPFLFTCAVLNAMQSIASGFMALSAVVLGHCSIAVASLIFVTAQIAAVLGRLAWGWVSDIVFRGDRTMPIAIICVTATVGSLGFAITMPSNIPVLFAAAFVVGFTGLGWPGLFAAAMVEIGGTRFAGSALGLGSTVNFVGGSFGPIAFGALADAQGLRVSWIVWAAILVLATIPALIAHRAFKTIALDRRRGDAINH